MRMPGLRFDGITLRAFAAFLCLVPAVLCTGCISRDRVYRDIRRHRQLAYDAWKRAKEQREGPQIVMEGDLSLASAVLIALGENKQLKAIFEEKARADGVVIESYSNALPRLDMEASYTRLDKVSRITVGGVTIPSGQKSNYAVNFIISQPIFRGGAIPAAIRGAQIAAYAADEQIDTVRQDVVNATRLAYYDVLLAQELVKVSEGDIELTKRHLDDVKKKKAAGILSEYDVLRAQVEVSNVEADYITRKNDKHIKMTILLKTLGVSQESAVRLSDELEFQKADPDLAESVRKAFNDRPEILEAELNVRLSREQLVEAWSGFLPSLDGTFTHSRARPNPRVSTDDSWGHSWEAALVMRWALFDGLASVGRTQQAKAALRQAVIQLTDAEEQVLLEVKQALLSIEDAEEFVRSQDKNLERAREAVRLAEAGYAAGVQTEVEMLDARQALSESQARYYQAVYSYNVATLALERATGAFRKLGKRPGK